MKVGQILKELDEFEKMLREYESTIRRYHKLFPKGDKEVGKKGEFSKVVQKKRKQRKSLIYWYSLLRPVIERNSQCFITADLFGGHETYKNLIVEGDLSDSQEIYDDLTWIRGSLDRFDPDAELDEECLR